jgi:hypothetical protein
LARDLKVHSTLSLKVFIAGAATAAIVGGILAVGHYLREDLRSRERYQLAVGEIECDSPPGTSREEFLEEVHYYGQLPEKLSVLDADLSEKLTTAFSKHPSVKQVGRVDISAPKRVRVELVFQKSASDAHE